MIFLSNMVFFMFQCYIITYTVKEWDSGTRHILLNIGTLSTCMYIITIGLRRYVYLYFKFFEWIKYYIGSLTFVLLFLALQSTTHKLVCLDKHVL